MKNLIALDGYIKLYVPVRLIVTEEELEKYDKGELPAQTTIYCMATEQIADNLDIADNDEPEFDDDRTITPEEAGHLIDEEGYCASTAARMILNAAEEDKDKSD